MDYPNSIQRLENYLTEAPKTSITAMAKRMMQGAKRFDLEKAENLGVNFKLQGIKRDIRNPTFIEHESILGAGWADNIKEPLQNGEAWNQGRRATNTDTQYDLDENGRPVNPYMNTGLTGRGVLGSFGPNHAVDNGALVLKADKNGKPTLYALGILRKFDNDAPAFAGGFAKYTKDENGTYTFDREAVIETQIEEFFEETISGSIVLLPEYEARFDTAFEAEITKRMEGRNGQEVSDDHKHEIREQIETGLKLQQVQDKDPNFLNRLRDVIAEGHECFAGPVLNDGRNTNTAWIETRLSWFMMDEDTWVHIKGDDPVFDYKFSAGDDASDVVYHKLDANLIQDAFASHGPMFAFMAASFVLDAQSRSLEIAPEVMAQIEGIADFLDTPKPAIEPKPQV